jgi:hypothetical protein
MVVDAATPPAHMHRGGQHLLVTSIPVPISELEWSDWEEEAGTRLVHCRCERGPFTHVLEEHGRYTLTYNIVRPQRYDEQRVLLNTLLNLDISMSKDELRVAAYREWVTFVQCVMGVVHTPTLPLPATVRIVPVGGDGALGGPPRGRI